MELNYSQEELARKILEETKIKYGTERLLSIIVAVLVDTWLVKEIITGKDILTSVLIALIFVIIFKLIYIKANKKYMQKIINLNYPEGLINYSIFYYKNITERSFSKTVCFINERIALTSIYNIAMSYLNMNDMENAVMVLKKLENHKTYRLGKYKKLLIANIKANIAKLNEDIDEMRKQSLVIQEIASKFKMNNFIIMDQLRISFWENNIDEVNNLCNKLNENNIETEKLVSAYYRAQIMEKNGIEGWKEYYKYVADNGNTFWIAKKAREKLGIKAGNINNIHLKAKEWVAPTLIAIGQYLISYIAAFILITSMYTLIPEMKHRILKNENAILYPNIMQQVEKLSTDMMNSVSTTDYKSLKKYIKRVDGSELTDQEMKNFLLNTQIYRCTLVEDNKTQFYNSIQPSQNDPNRGRAGIEFTALDGSKIANKLDYVIDENDIYFITDDINKPYKEIKTYNMAKDFEGDETVEYVDSIRNRGENEISIYSYKHDENGEVYIEILEEAKQDIIKKQLDFKISRYDIKIEDDYKAVSIKGSKYSIEDLCEEWRIQRKFNNTFKKTKINIFKPIISSTKRK